MFGWYKLKKFYGAQSSPGEWWERHYEADGQQWDDPEEYRKQLFYPLLMKYLMPGKKYLDAGSGLGGWLAFLRARGIEIEGIEQSPAAVELTKKIDPTLPVQVGDIRNLPFATESLDGYLTIGSWEYIEDGTEQLLKEAKRVLTSGGIIAIEVPYANPLRRWTYLPAKSVEVWIRTNLLKHKATFAWHIFRKGDFTSLLEEEGFELVELNPHDLPDKKSHYGLWVDWPWLRGQRPYQLNSLGLAVKSLAQKISPWLIATGMFIVARKK
jgi:SAM-dependent methyltransferase